MMQPDMVEQLKKAAEQMQSMMPPAGVPIIKGATGITLANSEIQDAINTVKRKMTAEVKRWAQAKPGSVEEQTLKATLAELVNQSNALVMIGQAVARGQY